MFSKVSLIDLVKTGSILVRMAKVCHVLCTSSMNRLEQEKNFSKKPYGHVSKVSLIDLVKTGSILVPLLRTERSLF